VNIGFAAPTMNAQLGFTASIYGFGGGLFFISYALLEIPSNLALARVGARRWLARIMITWGLASAATAAVVGPTSFLTIRFLLGVGEAGLFPGTILLFTYWFPDAHRARIIGSFTLALPVSVALGAPISTAILGLDGMLGVKGWQWIYIMEAIPTVLIGCFVLIAMNDKPEKAKWLSEPERVWLTSTLASERRAVEAGGRFSVWRGMANPKVLLLSVNYLGIVTASLGLLLFVPQIIKSLGATNMGTGYATSLAYVCGAISMMGFSWLSDKLGDRRWLLFFTCMLSTAGLVIAGATMGTWWSLAGMCIATIGFYGTKGPFWSMPTMILTGAAAAGGIAFINAFGNIGGALGPAIVGWLKTTTGSYAGGLYGLAAFTGVSALIALLSLNIPRRVGVSVAAPAE
jgi:ACS family tartrate transporter-like MFS transporter